MDNITLNAFITYLKSRKDDEAKLQLEKILIIAEKCEENNLEFADVGISESLWNDFQNSRNLK